MIMSLLPVFQVPENPVELAECYVGGDCLVHFNLSKLLLKFDTSADF